MGKSQGVPDSVEDSYRASNALLTDSLMNYKTVVSFGKKNIDFLINRYEILLQEPHKKGIKKAHISGLMMGYSSLVRFLFIGIIYYIAAKLIVEYNLDSH